MVYEITEYEPSDRVVLVGRGDKLVAVDEIRFSRHDNMTVIDYTADLTFLNWYRHVTRSMGSSLKKVGTKALDGLAAKLNRRTSWASHPSRTWATGSTLAGSPRSRPT